MYAIYLRKSRKDIELESLGEGETLARHREALTELAKKKGLVISKVYEEVVSGESIADRPQMQMLLDDVIEGKYKGVLVMEIERLARGNTKDQGEVSEAFAMSKTLIVTPTKTYDPTNEFDEEYFEFGLFMSRREYKTIRRRMHRGVIASVKEGNFVGSIPPYGYDPVRINKKERILVPNKEEAKYVKLMFDWFVNDGLTSGQIARRLTNMGVPTKYNKREWHRATVKDILKNVVYTGKIVWNKRKVVKEFEDGKVTKKSRRQSPENSIIVDGKHEAIIDTELFEKAQELFTSSAPVKANTTLKNPLAKLIFCKRCGRAVSRQTFSKEKVNTRMRIGHVQMVTCDVKSMPYDEVMEALITALKSIVKDFEFKMTNEHLLNEQRKSIEAIKNLEKELETSENKHKQLFDYLERNIYTESEFLERKQILNDKIENIKSELEEAKSKRNNDTDYEEKIIKFTEVIESLQDEKVDAKYKNQLLKEVIKRIDYDCENYGRLRGGRIILDIHLK